MRGHQSGWARERPVDFERMIAAMDEAGVAKSALVQASTSYTHDNSYVADAVAVHPKRFTGVFSVVAVSLETYERIGYWMSRGLAGLRVFIAGHTAAAKDARLDDPRSFPAWETAGKAGIPVCVQLRAEGLPQLVTVLERFARVRVVLDHMARPIVEDGPPYAAAARLFSLARYANLHLKLSAHNVRESRAGKSTPESLFARVVAEFGASRIAWGSNFPASEGSLPGLLAEARSALAALPSRDRDWIFFRTAQSCRKGRNQVYNRGSPVLRTQGKGAQVKKTLPVLLLSLVFAVDCLAQTPARDPIQVAQAVGVTVGGAGGASQGVGASAGGAGVGSTIVAIVAVGVAAALAVATSNSTTTLSTAANH